MLHEPVEAGQQLLVLLGITAAKIRVHDAQLQLARWPKGWLEIQTLWVGHDGRKVKGQETQDPGVAEPPQFALGTQHFGDLWSALGTAVRRGGYRCPLLSSRLINTSTSPQLSTRGRVDGFMR